MTTMNSSGQPSHQPPVAPPVASVAHGDSPAAHPPRLRLGAGHPVNLGVFGANDMLTARNHILENPGYRALVSALNVPITRFPGGSHASFWDWEKGNYIPVDEINRVWQPGVNNWMLDHIPVTNGHPVGTFNPIRIANHARALGVGIQWVPNMTTRAGDQLAMFECLKHEGVDVSYVEMDNEAYFWGAVFGEADRGENYARRVDQLSPELRKMFPEVQIGIIAHEDELFLDEGKSKDVAMAHWNAAIARPERAANFDALILHHYVMRRGRLDRYDNDRDRGCAFLAYPQVTLERAGREIERLFGRKPMWITEYNVVAFYWEAAGTSPSDLWMSSRRDTGWGALYQASFWLTGLSHPDTIGILNHHSIGEIDIGWGLGEPVDATSGMLSKTGQLFSHLAYLAKTHTSMHSLVIEGSPNLGVTIEGVDQISAIYGAALTTETKTTLLVMNRGSIGLATSIATASPGARALVTVYDANEATPGPDRALVQFSGSVPVWEQGPMSTRKSTALVGKDGSLALEFPSFSLAIVEIAR